MSNTTPRSAEFLFPVMVGLPSEAGEEEPMPKLRELKGKEIFALYAPFVGAFVVGLALRYGYRGNWLISEVAHLTGDAFAVAGVLGFVVELFVTSRLIDHTAKSLAERLIGYGLPSELQGEIRKIVETRLVRFNTIKRYRIQALPADSSKVTVHIMYSFEVRNYGDAPEPYAPWIAEEEIYDPQFEYLEYGVVGKPPHCYSDEKLREFQTIREPDRAREINAADNPRQLPKVELAGPFRENPKAICRVEWRYRITAQANDNDITSFAGAAIGAQVNIDDLPEGLRFVGETADTVGSTERSWTYTRPFLRNQHIRVRWFSK